MNSGSSSRQDLPSTSAGAAGPPGPPGGQRKERGAIAAQACDTCRSRKQKCDERRPKCSTCLRFKLECHYREVQPTKKDKTMVEILDIVKDIGEDQSVLEAVLQLDRKVDSKFDNLLFRLRDMLASNVYNAVHATSILPVQPDPLNPVGFGLPSQSHFSIPSHAATTSTDASQYKHVSSVSQMLAWPVVQQLLNAVASKIPTIRTSAIERDGPSLFLGIHDDSMVLPTEVTTSGPFNTEGRSRASQKQPVASTANMGRIQRLSKAYFDTFNFVYPILDRQTFQDSILARVLRDGFDDGIESTLAFLVSALGEVAIAGTLDNPPGLDLFNEARKRMGFNLTECSLENAQVLALASIYYGTSSHHTDQWRTNAMASLACQALILGKSIELGTPQGDLLKRAFWHCLLVETISGLNLEFNIPLTGLEKLEGLVGMPHFNGPFSEEDYVANEASHFREHFAAQIALRRLLVGFHNALSQGTLLPDAFILLSHEDIFSTTHTTGPKHSAKQHPHVLESHTIKYFAVQLEQWRAGLPAQLGWDVDQPGAAPGTSHEMYANPSAPSALFASSGPMFTVNLDAPAVVYQHAADLQTALLRTRYYFARYLLHRPFVYKALHFPGQMTDEDAQGVVQCLRAGLKWPLTMSPPSRHKRLVPCLFFWSQNLLGVLLLLSLSQQVPILLRIRSTMCGERFDVDAGETVGLYIDWIRDLSGADPAARWCWEVVKAVYRLDDE